MEENKTLVEVTTDKILRYLKEMQLQVGDKLPNEYELSDYLEVGRSTVREAVRAQLPGISLKFGKERGHLSVISEGLPMTHSVFFD